MTHSKSNQEAGIIIITILSLISLTALLMSGFAFHSIERDGTLFCKAIFGEEASFDIVTPWNSCKITLVNGYTYFAPVPNATYDNSTSNHIWRMKAIGKTE